MPPSAKVQIKLRKLLVVEGRDEENFFSAALTRYLGIADVQILPIGGKTLLAGNLKLLMNDAAFPSVEVLAVIRDADETPAASAVTAAVSAFDSVRSALTAQGIQLPCPAGHGQFADGPPRVGVFIMPDGASDGMLESLCARAASAHPAYACVTEFFPCLHGHGRIPNNMHKAHAHAWLASCIEPGRSVGVAALAGYWPFANSAFAGLWNFLRAM